MPCSQCVFWERFTDDKGGLCKRYAPRPILVTPEIVRGAEWVETKPDDWCGDFKQQAYLPG